MSVATILDETGRIAGQYLPAYVSSDVRNPMVANLDGGGYDMSNIDDIACSNILSKSHDVLDAGGATVGSLIAAVDGATLTCGLTVQGDGSQGLTVDGTAGITAFTASFETLDITTPGGGTGIAFTNSGNITGCGTIATTGINATGTIATTTNITATGTIVPSQWSSFPQSPSGTVVSLVGNASLDFVNILSASLTAGTYLITISFDFEKLGTSTSSNGISINYITAGAAEVLLLDTTEGDLEAQGYTNSFLYNTPVSGGFTVQLKTSALPVGQTYQITSYAGGQGFLKLT